MKPCVSAAEQHCSKGDGVCVHDAMALVLRGLDFFIIFLVFLGLLATIIPLVTYLMQLFRFSSVPFYKIVVPTVDTLRYDFLVSTLVKANRPVLLTGPVGTGKTSVAQTALEKLDPKIFSILTINMSAQVTVAPFC